MKKVWAHCAPYTIRVNPNNRGVDFDHPLEDLKDLEISNFVIISPIFCAIVFDREGVRNFQPEDSSIALKFNPEVNTDLNAIFFNFAKT